MDRVKIAEEPALVRVSEDIFGAVFEDEAFLGDLVFFVIFEVLVASSGFS
jgi:hypothetical protein